jgi:hypothetical protein
VASVHRRESATGAGEAERAAAVFERDKREASERLSREEAEREAAERAYAEYERAQREEAKRPDALPRVSERGS